MGEREKEGPPAGFSPVTFEKAEISLVNNSKLLSLLTLRMYLHTGYVKLWFNRCVNSKYVRYLFWYKEFCFFA